MIAGSFQFVIQLQCGGEIVDVAPASVAACIEHARFRGVQSGRLANDGGMPDFTLTPCWSQGKDSAITDLTLALPGVVEERFEVEVFAPQARCRIRSLVRDDRIPSGARVEWRVFARECEAPPAVLRARTVRAPYPLRAADLPELADDTSEVCFERGVLRRIAAQVDARCGVERAALLLGVLLHDERRRALRLHVADVIEVEPGDGGASRAHFAFRPDSFAVASRAARARGRAAIPCGWAHTHPPCSACAATLDCRSDTVFFSNDDADVHASAFPSPFAVGLVAGKLAKLPATRPGFRLYGWRSGRIAELPFRVLGAGGGWLEHDQSFDTEEC